MRIGVLSDIHSNLEALQSVLRTMQQWHVDSIINIGDIVGYSPSPDECIACIKKENIISVMGNYDDGIGNERYFFDDNFKENELKKIVRQRSFEWTYHHTSLKNQYFLSQLPLIIEKNSSYGKIGAVHASDDNLLAWITENDEDKLFGMAHRLRAKIVLLGHTHTQFVKKIDSIYFINPGSVGRPLDGDPRAGCAVIDISMHTVSTHLLRIPYDSIKNISKLYQSGLPLEIVYSLRHGVDQFMYSYSVPVDIAGELRYGK